MIGRKLFAGEGTQRPLSTTPFPSLTRPAETNPPLQNANGAGH